MTLKEIVEQLEMCHYADKEGHDLTMNQAFIELRQLAQAEDVGEMVIDHDELVGYIMRKAWDEHGEAFSYPSVEMILDYELEFLREKGLIDDENRV